MARVPVANPFREKGARSTAKAAAKSPVDSWTEDDQAEAMLQGWGVFEIIDGQSHKLFLEVQLHGVRFDQDEYARLFVAEREKAGDALAKKAVRVVFRSKAGSQSRTKK